MADNQVINPNPSDVYQMQGSPQDYADWQRGTPLPTPQALAPESPLAPSPIPYPPAPPKPRPLPELNIPPHPAIPAQQKMPPAPDARNYQKNSMAWASAMALLGAVAGHFTRAPGGAALGAFAAALNGWREGNLEAYENASKQWEQNNRAALENNRQELEKYRLVLEDNALTIEEQRSRMQLIAAENHNDQMYNAMEQRNWALGMKVYETNLRIQKDAELATAGLDKDRAIIESRQALLGARLSSGEINPATDINPKTGQPYTLAEQQTLKGIKERYEAGFYGFPGGGKGGISGVTGVRMSPRNQIIADLRRTLGREPSLDEVNTEEAKRAGTIAAARVTATAEPKALSATLTKLTQSANNLDQFENFAKQQGEALKVLADKVDRTGSPVLERWLRAGRQALAGDTDVTQFNAQMALYQAEVARILQGNPNLTGQLTDHAREEIRVFLNNTATAKQVRSVVDLVNKDFNRRSFAMDAQIAKVKAQLRGIEPETPQIGAPTFQERFKGGGTSDDPAGLFQ